MDEREEHEDCHVEKVERCRDLRTLGQAMAVYLAVGGMGCEHCANRVNNALVALEGVVAVKVYLREGIAVVAYHPQQATLEDLQAAVETAGGDGRHRYTAQPLDLRPAREAQGIV